MSPEAWTAFGTVGTLVVITATAIIGLVQLRHARAASHAIELHNLFNEYEGLTHRDAFHFVRTELESRLEDPEFRNEIRRGAIDRIRHPEITVLNFFEQLGALYTYGAIDRELFLRTFRAPIIGFWKRLEPVVALSADAQHGNLVFQHFERLTIEARRWQEEHPTGVLGSDDERIPLVDRWRDLDRATPPS